MIHRPPGIEDIFPDRIDHWRFIEDTARNLFKQYNYREIIVPVMEFTEVFARGLGDTTDIVTKEMFTFEDRGGRSLTLRPEGTASVVRAYVENGDYNRLALCKLFYFGPMFRAERPQKGRLRQFNQFGAEIFGTDDPYHDSEMISMMDSIAQAAGIKKYKLLINSIGCRDCRGTYIKTLKDYYHSHIKSLCKDCVTRLDKNPLRLLDCKEEGCIQLKAKAPIMKDHLCDSCRDHYSAVLTYLDEGNIKYTEDPYLVRGLDYYVKTTFEFTADSLGAQSAFAGGGRYDSLVEQFEGKPTPAVGFAAGMERIFLTTEDHKTEISGPDAYIIHSGGSTFKRAREVARHLRSEGLSVECDPASKGFKAHFKRADREKAKFAIIIGEDELKEGTLTLKNLATGDQQKAVIEKMPDIIKA